MGSLAYEGIFAMLVKTRLSGLVLVKIAENVQKIEVELDFLVFLCKCLMLKLLNE
jgi:hypothetical protein